MFSVMGQIANVLGFEPLSSLSQLLSSAAVAGKEPQTTWNGFDLMAMKFYL